MGQSMNDVDDILRRRFWLRENFEWLINEVVFHREMKPYFSNEKFSLWKYDQEKGSAKVYVAPEGPN